MDPPYYTIDPILQWRDSYVITWVAPMLVPLAQTGVVVNPGECIEWLADRETPFTRPLQKVHLLV
jgi:hypothetical protein